MEVGKGKKRWERTNVTNLLRNGQSGTYYARVKVNGKEKWRSLKTKVFSVAKLKVGDVEKDERSKGMVAAAESLPEGGETTVQRFIDIYLARTANDSALRPATKSRREIAVKAIIKTWQDLPHRDARRVTTTDCQRWATTALREGTGFVAPQAKTVRKGMSASAFNKCVDTLRTIFEISGGAWTEAEITILRKPMSSDVASALKMSADTHMFVAFSGHGADGSVVLNEWNLSFVISSLKPTSSRGILVVDSCRGVESRTYNFSAIANRSNSLVLANAKEGRSAAIKEAKYPSLYRSIWEKGFGLETGVVQMLACAKGQNAEEDPTAGGYYTSLLMAGAELWNKSITAAATYSTREAHNYAAQNLPPQQTPDYSPSSLAFPFAAKFIP